MDQGTKHNQTRRGYHRGYHGLPGFEGWGYRGVPLGTTVTTLSPTAVVGLLGLTGGQRFMVALVGAGFVLVLIVWPVIKAENRNPHVDYRKQSQRRLMHEIREHYQRQGKQ